MRASLNRYFAEQSVYDVLLVSMTGFDEDDIGKISALPYVNKAEGAVTRDEFVRIGDSSFLVRIHSLSSGETVGVPDLISGRYPERPNECVVNERFLEIMGVGIGGVVRAFAQIGDDIYDTLAYDEFIITGTIGSPLYLTGATGNSQKGSGNINAYVYIPIEGFAPGLYTEARIILNGTAGMSRFESDYRQLCKRYADELINEFQATYALTLSENIGFISFSHDAERIDMISRVFPLIFFLVAALVCMTNMLRIVDGEQTQIGTLKALGYPSRAIFAKYLFYALAVSVPGAVAGIAAGFWFFPWVIYNYGYKLLYTMETFITPIHWEIAFISASAAVASAVLPTVAVVYKELFASPAALLRPKAPNPGKRVLIERIPFIWNRCGFLFKVTTRNLFRYKKRFIMTVTGIAGCTALIMTGFGLYDSIREVAVRQFGGIYLYDYQINMRAGYDLRLEGYEYMPVFTANTYIGGLDGVSAAVVVPSDAGGFDRYVRFTDVNSKRGFKLDSSGAVITQKLSYLTGIRRGGTIVLIDADRNHYSVYVAGVTEHHVMHNIYMTPELYESVFLTKPEYNSAFGILDNGKDGEERIAHLAAQIPEITGLSFNSRVKEFYTDMIESLGFVVVILTISAALLAFVVLISLTGINIDERRRELATLKVLGFYDKETAAYILRENIALTVIGTGFGLLLGIVLHRFVIETAEVDMVMFGRTVQPMSFLYAALLTLLFSGIVTVIMGRTIKRVDMMESLKSVE
jgi:putative ABC transport system permease protein